MLIDCPGCGLQRSVWAILHGDISAAWQIYPPGIFVVVTICLLVAHLLFSIKHGATILMYSYVITALTILINYTYKIINLQLL